MNAVAFKTSVHRIADLAKIVAEGGQWEKLVRQPSIDVYEYLHRVIATLVEADGVRDMQERAALTQLFGDGFSYSEEDQWLRTTANPPTGHSWPVPAFFRAALRHDSVHHSAIAAEVLAELDSICTYLTRCDGVVVNSETVASQTIMAPLRSADEQFMKR